MKLPARAANPEWPNKGSPHWDTDITDGSLRFEVQGVLLLADTPAAGAGGFQCLPGFVNQFESWFSELPRHSRPSHPRYSMWLHCQGHAAPLLIWHQHMPHGNSLNTSQLPRFAQYIALHVPHVVSDSFPPRDTELGRKP
jgi:hypothetical protein